MKRIISVFLCLALLATAFTINITAIEETSNPIVLDFIVTTEPEEFILDQTSTPRVTGLINSYGLSLSKSGTTLNISGRTYGSTEVIKCGFKNLTVERRKTSDDSWEDYYEYGNVYVDGIYANLSTTLVVASGYQYRISCKHYAKKNLLAIQTVSNTSNIVTVS